MGLAEGYTHVWTSQHKHNIASAIYSWITIQTWFPLPVFICSIITILGKNVWVKASSSPWPSSKVLLLVVLFLYFMMGWAMYILSLPHAGLVSSGRHYYLLFISGKAVYTTMLPTVYLKQRLPCSPSCVEVKFRFLYNNCWSFPSFFPELIILAHLLWAFSHCGSVLIGHMGFYIVWIRIASSTKIKIWSRKKHASVVRHWKVGRFTSLFNI